MSLVKPNVHWRSLLLLVSNSHAILATAGPTSRSCKLIIAHARRNSKDYNGGTFQSIISVATRELHSIARNLASLSVCTAATRTTTHSRLRMTPPISSYNNNKVRRTIADFAARPPSWQEHLQKSLNNNTTIGMALSDNVKAIIFAVAADDIQFRNNVVNTLNSVTNTTAAAGATTKLLDAQTFLATVIHTLNALQRYTDSLKIFRALRQSMAAGKEETLSNTAYSWGIIACARLLLAQNGKYGKARDNNDDDATYKKLREELIEYLDEVQRLGYTLDWLTAKYVFRALADDQDRAARRQGHVFLQYLREKDLSFLNHSFAYALAIELCTKADRLDTAVELYLETRAKRIPPQPFMFTSLFWALTRSIRKSAFKGTVDASISHIIYEDLKHASAKFRSLSTMVRSVIVTRYLECLAALRDLPRMVRFFDTELRSLFGIEPTVRMLSIRLKTAMYCNDLVEAKTTFSLMCNRVSPGSRITGSADRYILRLLFNHHYGTALRAQQQQQQSKDESHGDAENTTWRSTYIRFIMKELVTFIREAMVSARGRTTSTSTSAPASTPSIKFTRIQLVQLYADMLKLYAGVKDFEGVMNAWNRIKYYCSGINGSDLLFDGVDETSLEVNSPPPQMTIRYFNNMLSACVQCGEIHYAEEILHEMQHVYGLRPNYKTRGLQMQMYAVQGDFSSFRKALIAANTDAIRPNIVTFSLFIIACLNNNDVEKALKVPEMMRNVGVEPTVETYNLLIAACERAVLSSRPSKSKSSDADVGIDSNESHAQQRDTTSEPPDRKYARIALNLFEEMKRLGIVPEIGTYCTLIRTLRQSDPAKQFELYYQMKQLSSRNPLSLSKYYHDPRFTLTVFSTLVFTAVQTRHAHNLRTVMRDIIAFLSDLSTTSTASRIPAQQLHDVMSNLGVLSQCFHRAIFFCLHSANNNPAMLTDASNYLVIMHKHRLPYDETTFNLSKQLSERINQNNQQQQQQQHAPRTTTTTTTSTTATGRGSSVSRQTPTGGLTTTTTTTTDPMIYDDELAALEAAVVDDSTDGYSDDDSYKQRHYNNNYYAKETMTEDEEGYDDDGNYDHARTRKSRRRNKNRR